MRGFDGFDQCSERTAGSQTVYRQHKNRTAAVKRHFVVVGSGFKHFIGPLNDEFNNVNDKVKSKLVECGQMKHTNSKINFRTLVVFQLG